MAYTWSKPKRVVLQHRSDDDRDNTYNSCDDELTKVYIMEQIKALNSSFIGRLDSYERNITKLKGHFGCSIAYKFDTISTEVATLRNSLEDLNNVSGAEYLYCFDYESNNGGDSSDNSSFDVDDVDDGENDSDFDLEKQRKVVTNISNRSSSEGTKDASKKSNDTCSRKHAPKNVTYANRHHHLADKDNLPHHDWSKFSVDEKRTKEVMRKLRDESKAKCKSMWGQTGSNGEVLGKTNISKNHSCHICHVSCVRDANAFTIHSIMPFSIVLSILANKVHALRNQHHRHEGLNVLSFPAVPKLMPIVIYIP